MKKPHPADVANLAAIPAATSFVVSLFLGTGKWSKSTADTLVAARLEAERINEEVGKGNCRRALIYAMLPDGRQFLVPNDYQTEENTVAKPTKKPAKPATKKKATEAPHVGKRAALEAAARAGKLPPPPDFSAPTHARFRNKLAEVVALAKAGDAKALRAFEINPVSSSPKAIDRYRNLCVLAIDARR